MSEFVLFMLITLALLSALCAAVCLKRVSQYSSLARTLRDTLREVQSFESRIAHCEARIASAAKAMHLEARRDPETGRSTKVKRDAFAESDWKVEARKKLGLNGPDAARVAQRIHQNGGI